eukprot:CAMPEP_0119294932 /NCGR_PEP_ID=MMETSP1329-20130426/48914_1 /TAXON_ID=114041 /ORGANISM="Genus nov. species nov., Strain RCC1024" /LENGTH=82 /DNA_ID=CAMNT_0007295837 /DNA_START=48 /DNA_END=292 /DNA_ORIENTATION=-
MLSSSILVLLVACKALGFTPRQGAISARRGGHARPQRSLAQPRGRAVAAAEAQISYGETGGAALVLDDLSVRRGPVELVTGA